MLKYAFRCTSVLLLSGGAKALPVSSSALAACYPSMQEAVRHAGKEADAGSALSGAVITKSTGWRVHTMRWDPLLGRNWTTVLSCDHPERPAVVLASDSVRSTIRTISAEKLLPDALSTHPAASAGGRPAVVAGDAVRLMYRDDRVQMELAAIAEGNGNVGDAVTVRVVRYGPEAQRLTGVIRGSHVLELQRPIARFEP